MNENISKKQYTDIYLNLYTFKRCTLMQSSVLSILSEHKSDPTERPVLIELFHTLDTTKKGYLVAEDLRNGF